MVSVARVSVASPSVPRPSNTLTHAPTLLQRLTEPLKPKKSNATSLCPVGGAVQQSVTPGGGVESPQSLQQLQTTQPTYSIAGSIPAQGHIPICKPAATSTPLGKPVKVVMKRAGKGKKQANILPRPDQNQPGPFPTIVPKNLSNTQYTTQDLVYSTVDPQTNAETKVMVKTLLAKKLRQGNVIITQPGVMNVNELNTSQYQGENQVQLQYQTAYSQPVPQTAYIQYNSPTQSGVQTIVQPNQTSQLQTFVVQPQVFVQSHPQTSSLQQQFIQQPIIQQQPVVAQQQIITQQQPIIAQQQTMFTQQPYVAQQQVISPQVITQPQYVTTYQPQIAAAFPQSSVSSSISDQSQGAVSTSQSDVHSSRPSSQNDIISSGSHLTSSNTQTPADLEVCGETEKAKDIIEGGEEAKIEKVEIKTDNGHNESCIKNEVSDIPSSSDMHCESLNIDKSNQMETNIELEPKVEIDTKSEKAETGTESNFQSELDVSTAESELESAVGSILEDENNQFENSEPMTQEAVFQNANKESEIMEVEDEEPVMIENDGNELMFEACYSGNNEENNYEADNQEKDLIEAAAAIEQLEQSGNEQIGNTTESEMNVSVTQQTEISEPIAEEQQYFEMETERVQVNGDIAKESKHNDITSCVTKIRSDIVVPSVAENGLYEQDFEARMAVENLLKDVEFHVNGDDACSEENINVFSCQQQSNPGSVQTVNSAADDNIENGNEDSQDNVITSVDKSNESQSNSLSSNHNGTEETKSIKSQKTINHITENGIDSEHKPLMNGHISSPEYQSDLVPSPTEETKLTNCINTEKDISKTIDKVSKLNGVVNHKISKNQVLEVNTVTTSYSNDTKMEVESPGIDSKIDKAQGDILAQSILVNDIQASDADIPDPEPTIIPVVKQFVPNQIIGNIMTVNCVQINNNAMSVPVGVSNCIAFTNNPLIASKVQLSNPVSVYSSQKISTSDGALIYNSSPSSSVNSDLKVIVTSKHSSSSSKGSKDKSLTSPGARPKSGDGKKSKSAAKKRSRSKSGGNSDSRPSSTASSSSSTPAPPEFMCEWSQCRR